MLQFLVYVLVVRSREYLRDEFNFDRGVDLETPSLHRESCFQRGLFYCFAYTRTPCLTRDKANVAFVWSESNRLFVDWAAQAEARLEAGGELATLDLNLEMIKVCIDHCCLLFSPSTTLLIEAHSSRCWC
jgi:hypothetical protein